MLIWREPREEKDALDVAAQMKEENLHNTGYEYGK